MFEIYTSTSASYDESQPITFTTVRHSDCNVTNTGNNNFAIRRAGRYYINFTGVAASNVATDTFTVQLYKNGTAVPGVVSTITSVAAGDQQTLSLGTVLDVRPSCIAVNNTANLQIMVTSTSTGTLSSGDLIITKVS